MKRLLIVWSFIIIGFGVTAQPKHRLDSPGATPAKSYEPISDSQRKARDTGTVNLSTIRKLSLTTIKTLQLTWIKKRKDTVTSDKDLQ